MTRTTELNVNGLRHRVETDPDRSLLQVLREDLDLTGAKYGCGEGQCGACTVLVGGKPTRSCITPVATVAGKPITTIEGLEQKGRLHPVQEAFLAEGAMQCGYCIPGMILSAKAFLDECPAATEAEVREALAGNLCRCTGYQKIADAVVGAARATPERR